MKDFRKKPSIGSPTSVDCLTLLYSVFGCSEIGEREIVERDQTSPVWYA